MPLIHSELSLTPLRSEILTSRRLERCQFRVLGSQDQLDRSGRPTRYLQLGNLAGTALSAIPLGGNPTPLHSADHSDIIEVTGELCAYPSHWQLMPEITALPQRQTLKPTALLPREWVLPTFLPALRVIIRHWSRLSTPALRQFLNSVFVDSSNAMGVLNAPGSLRHHHAYQGGLLEHTADMLVRYGGTYPSSHDDLERDIATTLIIIHDLGKTLTLVGADRGATQPHDMAALELLATPLAELEMFDPALANILRGYFRPKQWYPKADHPSYALISRLDKQSGVNALQSARCQRSTPYPHNNASYSEQ
ncbi:hypothetical protein I6N98_13095 [Spongiibacter nanhainus]|uniref:HD domain-containing protein n=1 Tax=Spongiibacter nanhainus TaxID=2794344 RepID=A0A7T4QYZ6_9GAMM|nr:hypothetical protein [Spongiibacter nanhainus]QQD17296.1 hypothetical protein I6N98_13095 [Spongiibacter nanhainus]